MLVEFHRFLLFHALALFPLPIVIFVRFFYPRKSPYGHEYALLIQLSVLRRIGTRIIDSILIGATFTYFSTEDACVNLFRITTRPWRIRLDDHRTPDNNSSMYQDGLLLLTDAVIIIIPRCDFLFRDGQLLVGWLGESQLRYILSPGSERTPRVVPLTHRTHKIRQKSIRHKIRQKSIRHKNRLQVRQLPHATNTVTSSTP